jgi:hypothetical protein
MSDQAKPTERMLSSVSQLNSSTHYTELTGLYPNVSHADVFPQSVRDHAVGPRLWPLLSSGRHPGVREDNNSEFMTVFFP